MASQQDQAVTNITMFRFISERDCIMSVRNAFLGIFLVCVATCSDTSYSQSIPNGGFEQWSGGTPTGWKTSNAPPSWSNVLQSSTTHGGALAAQGSVVDFSGVNVPPSLLAGADGRGFPIASRPEALHGWYTLNPEGGDGFMVSVALKKNGSAIGAGIIADATVASVFREFVVDIMYGTSDIPDTVGIAISVMPFNPPHHFGTFFIVDDLSWGPTSGVPVSGGVPLSFGLEQNFPNPFNPTTHIVFHVARSSYVSLKVFDLLGREVAQLVSEDMMPGTYRAALDGAKLPSGGYFYRLQAGAFSATKRLLLLR
jgi:hypothetical protein